MSCKRSKVNTTDELARRAFIKRSLLGTAGAIVYGTPLLQSAALGQSPRRPFVVYLHMGSFEGYSAGLMMPTDVGIYPKGVFFANQVTEHRNPNVNRHFKTGNLVFNDYTKVLEPIASNMLFAVASPQSLSHDEAFRIQQTGTRFPGSGASPMWAAGFAQAVSQSGSPSFVITDGRNRGVQPTAATTPRVSSVTAATVDEAKANFSDPTAIPKNIPEAARYLELQKEAFMREVNASGFSSAEKTSAQGALDGLFRGIPNVDPANSAVQAALTRSNLNDRLANVVDKEAVIGVSDAGDPTAANAAGRGLASIHDRFRLAAVLIETQAASGIHINVNNIHDYHNGGAHVRTARTASMIWTQLAQFWEWVRAKGYQNDVLVIVANEFNRTPANGILAAPVRVKALDSQNSPVDVDVVSDGTDHHLSCGFVFLHGSLPPASRLGAIGDTFVPTGGPLNAGPKPGVPAFTSLQLVSSVFMRAFPSVFPDYRAVRKIWSSLKESDIIEDLID